MLTFFDEGSRTNFEDLITALRGGGVSAIIGSGLSASHHPDWVGLFDGLQAEAGFTPRRPFRAEDAAIDFGQIRDALPDGRFLKVFKEQFGGAVADYPPLYRVINETSGFETLVTTNYDEFLATIAQASHPQPTIAVYPQYKAHAKYVYLHGRASTAECAGDLVVCEDDYARAYDLQAGHALIVLKQLLFNDVMFVGCSMQDPDIRRVLREAARIRTYTDLRLGPDPFVILAARKERLAPQEQTLDDYVQIETNRLKGLSLRPIWFIWDAEYTRLDALLREMQHRVEPTPADTLFLERAERLERAGQEPPSETERGGLLSLMQSVPELSRHFLQHATEVSWYPVLLERGIITAVREPYQQGDVVRIKAWPALPFVRRVAENRPEIVVELLTALRSTKNWQVRNELSELAIALPLALAKESLPVLSGWARSSDFARLSLVGHNLIGLFERLAEESEYEIALTVLAAILQPRSTEKALDRSVELVGSGYELERLETPLRRLAEALPAGTYSTVQGALTAVLEAAGTSTRASSIWRPAIEDHEQNWRHSEQGLNFLVSATRDALNSWAQSGDAAAVEELNRLLASEGVYRRLALHSLVVEPSLLAHISEPPFTSENFFEVGHYHELMLLIRSCFGYLSEDLQALTHQMIREGPPVRPSESVESHAARVAAWRRTLLTVVPEEFFSDDESRWFDEIGRPQLDDETILFLSYVTVGWGSLEQDQPTDDDLGELDFDELLSRLRAAPADDFARTTWDSLRSLVLAEPDRMLGLAAHFTNDDLEKIWPYLDGYLELLKARKTYDWTPIVELAERAFNSQGPPPERVQWEFGWFLREGIRSAEYGFAEDLLDRAVGIAIRIVGFSAHALHSPWEPDRELTSHQLNDPAGQAADAIVFCIWRSSRASRAFASVTTAATDAIDYALSDGWGGVEMRFAIGRMLKLFEWIEHGWIGGHREQLMPGGESRAELNARKALICGFLTEQPSSEAMLALRPLYAMVLPDLSGEQPNHLNRGERWEFERLAEHVTMGWLWGLDGFGFDGLLGTLLSTASDDVLSHVAWWLRRDSETWSQDLRDERRPLMRAYWDARLAAMRDLPLTETREELARLCAWPTALQLDPAEAESQLNVCIDHLKLGYGAEDLMDYIQTQAEPNTAVAVRLLGRVVRRWLESDEFYWSTRKLSGTMEVLLSYAQGDERRALEALVSRLAEAGIDLRRLLGGSP